MKLSRILNHKKFPSHAGFVVILLVLIIAFANADTIDLLAGHSYYVDIEANSMSNNWVGLKVVNDIFPLQDRIDSFISVISPIPSIVGVTFPGANLKDDEHYYAAMLPNVDINLNNIFNTSSGDLAPDQLFSEDQFSTFYPDYASRSDNPSQTFIDGSEIILVGGVNYTALTTEVAENITYYLLKYNNSGKMTPLFLSRIADANCYNMTSCVSEFMLPINPDHYYFYVLSENEEYEFATYIDGSSTASDVFSQTALPYIVRVDATYLYTGLPAENLSIIIGEENGQNLFVPYKLTGYVSDAYSIGIANSSGSETFLISPTVYPTLDNYSIYVAALVNDDVVSIDEFTVTLKDELVTQSKPVFPSTLYDNAKASINAMNQLNSALFQWSSEIVRAHKYRVVYELTTGNFTTYRYTNPSFYVQEDITLKTGAPNVFLVYVQDSGVPQANYYSKLQEKEGYLIMNPYTESSPLDEKDRRDFHELPIGTEFIITPTSYGMIDSTINLSIINGSGHIMDTLVLDINSSLNFNPTEGISYNNDILKEVVNAMTQILNSLFYALNF